MEQLSLCLLVWNVPKSGPAPTLRQLILRYCTALLGTYTVVGYMITEHVVSSVVNHVFREDVQDAADDVAFHFDSMLNEMRREIEVVAAASELGRIKEDADATRLYIRRI